MEILQIVGQVVFGLFFVVNGVHHLMKPTETANYAKSKQVPLPMFTSLATGVLLILGGGAMVIGYYVMYALLALVVFLVVVAFWMHAFWSVQDPSHRMNEMFHFMNNIAMAGALCLLTAYVDSWPWVF
ncbi:DoxX family protein [Candidatus Peregrinibacteria bacterium CG22_combo_CG10-13_8_21_14_all_44_10]|nr:MAG: hypothetical protein AUK45_01640 [Candidatus Peregrinibacteria bacterium CG2_30_44_17]PIP66419.1 MAG: DoxX family protein [Candidatus Peregrinibacteria bacterium CG22_combo_CG10-13_8_21_14_all_44_10]PIS03760.1 MAG: DoxX family protein [Candidatus Peregrinibacteria bacterium CG10_big_fil_rev_8_21_14_0_10_44_7]PIX80030.1 MAG: DoxX family protein [Candidatus Peregrinibacteria bacterium CG_4_10_14_3_um_filter_44_21]PJB89379.1 MAG: DoxX family protein [Candidatus Peregrinibacteria bacterium 